MDQQAPFTARTMSKWDRWAVTTLAHHWTIKPTDTPAYWSAWTTRNWILEQLRGDPSEVSHIIRLSDRYGSLLRNRDGEHEEP